MKLSLKAEKREITGKKVSKLREDGKIPAVMYGQETEPKNLLVDYNPFEKVYKEAGESTLVELELENEKIPVLIHDVSYHPVTDKIEHIDFYKIKYGQKLTASVELKFIGESRAVKELGGTLVITLNEVEVECLPKDLISEIEVDLGKLETFEDVIHIKDLKVPETIKILADKDDVVAKVSQPRVAEEEEKAEESKEEEKKEEKKEEEKVEENKE